MTNNNPPQGPFQKKKKFDGAILLIQILRGALLGLMGRREMYSYEFFFFIRTHQWNIWAFFFSHWTIHT